MASQDLLSLLNLMNNPEVTGELAALLAQPPGQSQPEPVADPSLDSAMASLAAAFEPGASAFPPAPGAAWQSMQDAATKNLLLQEMAQSLAATMEQQRKQQQLATALQLRAYQQQQELAAMQQFGSLAAVRPQHQAALASAYSRGLSSDLDGRPNAYQRAFSSDLEYRTAPPPVLPAAASRAAYQRTASVELEGLGSPLAAAHPGLGLQHAAAALMGPPARSYSSEALEPRRYPLTRGTPLHLANPPPSRAPPGHRPSFPSARNPGPRGARHGASRHATAKAPCWAGSDWHPLKAVLSSANHAAAPSGTGVFLPHLADQQPAVDSSKADKPSAGSLASSSDAKPQAVQQAHNEPAACSSSDASVGTNNSVPDASPACSVDGVSTCSDPWSRSSTLDMDAAHCAQAPAPAAPSPLSVEPQAQRPGPSAHDEPDEFGPLAKELAELMSRQVIFE